MGKNVGRRKALIIATIVCVSLLVGILGSYAFFISTGGNNTPEELSVQTGNMALTFSDGSSSFQGSLEFGSSATKSFSIENTGSLEAKGKIKWLNLINTYTKGSLTYTLSYSETEEGEYTPIIENRNVPTSSTEVTKTLAPELIIPVGQTYYYKLVITLNYLTDIDQTPDLNAILSTEFKLEEATGIDLDFLEGSERTLAILNLKAKSGTPTFANAATTDETVDGLYSMEDDYGTSYYFRGAVENNYVKFAGFYWRIIRINGDGSLRMIYDGTQAHTNGEQNIDRIALSNVQWETNSNDAKYAGYMYGGENGTASTKRIELGQKDYNDSENAIFNETDSNIKIQLENWYKTNIHDKNLDQYISDNIFCNDRSISGKEISNWPNDTALGYNTNETVYGAGGRFGDDYIHPATQQNPVPNLKCPNKNDAFTKENSKGNLGLKHKIGIITADEVVIAGSGQYGIANSSYYLYKGHEYWTMSPEMIYSGHVTNYKIASNGSLYDYYVIYASSAAPVINLSPEYVSQMIGNGTIGNEYRVE